MIPVTNGGAGIVEHLTSLLAANQAQPDCDCQGVDYVALLREREARRREFASRYVAARLSGQQEVEAIGDAGQIEGHGFAMELGM